MNSTPPNLRQTVNVETPCIKVCRIDDATKLCSGCGRSLAEIARWGTMTNAERRAIMAELPRRLNKT